MFITPFKVKWSARLNKLYLSITKHKSHFFISSTSSFFLSSFNSRSSRFVSFRFLCENARVTKKQFKLFITLLIAFHECLSEKGEQNGSNISSGGRTNKKKSFCHFHHTYVSSHKSCFAKLNFFVFSLSLYVHTKRDHLTTSACEGYLIAIAKT